MTAVRDLDGDGDALDPGESVLFASGLNGASALRRAADGGFWLSGVTDLATGTGAVARLAPDGDGDGLSDAIDATAITGLGSFSSELVLTEGAAGLVPGAAGDGALWISLFTTAGPLYAGNVIVRSAPHAALAVHGRVANESIFELALDGEPGAVALAVLSLDASGTTLYGMGDTCVGFGAPHLVLPLGTVAADGEASTPVVLHGVQAAVGLEFVVQGFALLGGEVGIGNAIPLVIAP